MTPQPPSTSPFISLEALDALQDIFEKHQYLLTRAHRLLIKLAKERESEQHVLDQCHRALSKFQSHPLDTEQDRSSLENQRAKLEKQLRELSEELREVMGEYALVSRATVEMDKGMEENIKYTEWVVMPNITWNLTRMG